MTQHMDSLSLLVTEPFLQRALVAGLLLTVLTGPLGCFLIWRRQAFFGDTLAHASVLGIGLGALIGVGAPIGLIVIIGLVALFLTYAEGRYGLALDTLLGVLAHGGLALGLLLVSMSGGLPGGINQFLFGDILAVTSQHVITMAIVTPLGLGLLARFWKGLLALTLNQELAAADGYDIRQYRLLLMVLTGAIVGFGIKLVGALLISALLIIPAAAARRIASGPEQMAISAVICGMIAIVGGLGLSLIVNAPAGPAIISVATIFFLISLIGNNKIIRR